MILPGRSLFAGLTAAALTITVLIAGLAGSARADGLFDQPKYAAIVVDANTGEVLYTRRQDAQRYPASLTKLMTLYLTFEALSTGRLAPGDAVPFSRWATLQVPSKLGVREGRSITVTQAVQAAAVKSANDVAVALAEKIGGSEARFAELMTLRAQELGMTGTRYVNASGLPDNRQVTTARDIAILSRAIMRDYPQYYAVFGQRSFNWAGQNTLNHNRLLIKMPGVDGLKTGYTNAAGFNLAASAVRNGRRLIAVVLGGSSTAARDENVEDLLNAGFDVMRGRASGEHMTLASVLHAPLDDAAGPVTRPMLEMGSADQPSLRVVAGHPQPMRLSHLETSLPLAAAEVAATARADCTRLRGRRHRAACRAAVIRSASVGCGAHRRGHRHSACPGALRIALRGCPRHGRRARACRLERQAAVATTVADATPRLRTRCRRHGHRACSATLAATTAQAQTASGSYTVQVGAFRSRREARRHLAALASHRSGRRLRKASTEVAGTDGTYHAQFAGLSRAQARAACRRLSGRGQRCQVSHT